MTKQKTHHIDGIPDGLAMVIKYSGPAAHWYDVLCVFRDSESESAIMPEKNTVFSIKINGKPGKPSKEDENWALEKYQWMQNNK